MGVCDLCWGEGRVGVLFFVLCFGGFVFVWVWLMIRECLNLVMLVNMVNIMWLVGVVVLVYGFVRLCRFVLVFWMC